MIHDSTTKELRVLAVRPTTRGLGFAVLEGPERLVDWGVKSARGDKNAQCLRQVTGLFEHYKPDILVTEDYRRNGLRRAPRMYELLDAITGRAAEQKIRSRKISRSDVRKLFSARGGVTKHQIASAIASCFPELAAQLPPKRKPWMAEDARMGLFDSLALALAFFGREGEV